MSSSCGSSCTCTHPRTIEFYHVEHRDPLVLSSFVTRRHLSPFIRLHYIYAHHDIYTYNVQTTRNPPFFPEHAHPLAHAHAHPLRSDASHRSKSNDPRVHHARGSTISRNLKRNGKPFFFPPISFEISSPTSMHIYIYKLIGDGRTRVAMIRVAANAGSVGSLDVPRSCGSQLLHAGKELLLLPLLVSCVYMYPLR